MCLNPLLLTNPMAQRLWNLRSQTFLRGVRNFSKDMPFHTYTTLCGFNRSKYSDYSVEFVDEVVNSCYIFVNGTRINCFINVPCGSCSHCLDGKRREYTSRALFEASDFPNMLFFTLTYANSYLPKFGLHKPHVQQFLKLFRERLALAYSERFECDIKEARSATAFRVLYVGEYGVDPRYTKRPHYHGIIFLKNHLPHKDFFWFFKIFRQCWKYGTQFDLQYINTPAAAARYVTKYITKQQMYDVVPEGKNSCFIQGPHKCGLGSACLDNHLEDILKSTNNRVTLRIGSQVVTVQIPKFLLTKVFPSFSRVFNKLVPSFIDLFSDLKLIRAILKERRETSPLFPVFNVEDYDYLLESFSYLGDYDHKPMSLARYKSLHDPYSEWHNMSDYYDHFGDDELIDIYVETLYACCDYFPNQQQFIEMFFGKLQWQNNLVLPDLPLQQRLSNNESIVLNNFNYVQKRMLGDEFCLHLQSFNDID